MPTYPLHARRVSPQAQVTANSVFVPGDFIPLAPQPSLQAAATAGSSHNRQRLSREGSPGTLAEHPGHQTSYEHGPQVLLSPWVLLPLLAPARLVSDKKQPLSRYPAPTSDLGAGYRLERQNGASGTTESPMPSRRLSH